MQSFAIFALLAASVLAQNTPDLIPDNISKDCESYLKKFEDNSQVRACLRPIAVAANSSSVDAAVKAVCAESVDNACKDSFLRSELSDFYEACADDVASNDRVKAIYDALYMVGPFREAICSTGDDGEYCAESIAVLAKDAGSAIGGLLNTAQTTLTSSLGGGLTSPNANTFSSTGLPFLFLSDASPDQVLCGTCGEKVMAAYTKFETALPYGPGIAQSPMLSKQKALWTAMEAKCNPEVVANAGSAPAGSTDGDSSAPILGGSISGANTVRVGSSALAAVAALVGAVAFAL